MHLLIYTIIVVYFRLIDESVRWLWGQGRTAEAVQIVKKATEMNGKPFDGKFDGKIVLPSTEGKSYGIG